MVVDPIAARFEGGLRALDGTLDMPSTDGNRVTPIFDGVNAFPQMLDMIRNGKCYINLENFQVEQDETGIAVATACMWALQHNKNPETGKAPVVRFSHDSFGSGNISQLVDWEKTGQARVH